MWFKNLIVYRMTASWQLTAAQVEEAVSANAQPPIGLTQPVSTGWEPIFDGLFAHVVNRQILLQFKTEKKVVPSSALKTAVAERVEEVERMTGRKPGKKERREIKDDALLALLPSALATIAQTRVWIDPVTLCSTRSWVAGPRRKWRSNTVVALSVANSTLHTST